MFKINDSTTTTLKFDSLTRDKDGHLEIDNLTISGPPGAVYDCLQALIGQKVHVPAPRGLATVKTGPMVIKD